ncbi:Isochorismate synthase dhbC [Propionibacterium australiense]|uniref:ADC synthase n=2 Tax=Propionibacterium australiense TaxID=119981 RepID=A0A383S3H5_9ACTN|nr:isochorismate synthase [Propionibacterium australiense]RLP12619.1 isochorismate synthase [Propionibacterium australiense]SYZ32550.1 ADC synthase [Propionibacterium australiense]VEH91699.1 Isochorismate synthase dhbC [Propionibacterium australiense]
MRASTAAIADPGPLTDFLDGSGAAFLRGQDGFIALGQMARLDDVSMDEADGWWEEFSAQIENETEMPEAFGTGPIAYGSFTYDPARTSQRSCFVVPEVIVGRREGRCWVTRLGYDRVDPVLPERHGPATAPGRVRFETSEEANQEWLDHFNRVKEYITAGRADRVVLLRQLDALAEGELDPRWVLHRWRLGYGGSWAYLVSGLVGATHEVMVRRRGGLTVSRILAGSVQALGGMDEATRTAQLLSSSERLSQHHHAVAAAAESLSPFMTGMHVPRQPFALSLPDGLNLATDICGVASPGHSCLALASALHPLASVTGSPLAAAREIIDETSTIDRGRFGAPVGWIDAQGDGEWFAALRACQLGQRGGARLYASATVSAGTSAHDKLVSTQVKLSQMRRLLTER